MGTTKYQIEIKKTYMRRGMLMNEIVIAGRKIGQKYSPFVIAEIGINHEGDFNKAIKMIDDAAAAGAECVKIQSHVVEDEMIPNSVVPIHTKETIWDIMSRCSLTEEEEIELKRYVESKNMIFMSTPFSRAAAIRLDKMGVSAYKIGSGECNNYPLIEHIAQYQKPIILSTGMNNIKSIEKSVQIFRKYKVPFALLHCTSIYPTPYDKVRLGALGDFKKVFPDAVLGLSDHTITNYTCFGAVALGASILERHFTSDKSWTGPDIKISMNPKELKNLIVGSKAIHEALGGIKDILKEEQPTIDFAYACVVATDNIAEGEQFTKDNIWVKRPGTGEIKAIHYKELLGKRAITTILKNQQIQWNYVDRNEEI